MKGFKCREMSDSTREPDSSLDFPSMEEFEEEEREKVLNSAGKVWGTTVGKKRSRCLYLPDDKVTLENSVIPPELLRLPPALSKADNKPSVADKKASSISAKYYFSAGAFEDPWIIETTQDVSGVLKEKKAKLKALDINKRPFVLPCGKTNFIIKNRNLEIIGALNLNAYPGDQNRDEFDSKTGEKLDFEVEKLAESPIAVAHMEDASRYMTDLKETALFDAHVTVQASFREEHAPYVCLTSQVNGKPILGYPLDIGALSESCETFLPFDDNSSSFHRLAWRTSMRTPVCYITNSQFYTISKNVRNEQEKLPKNPRNSKKVGVILAGTCVPVDYIFGKILTAVGKVQS